MLFVRTVLIKDMSSYLSKAVTIALRYSLVRRQSPINPNEPEPKIIEHVTQQFKIYPAIAKVLGELIFICMSLSSIPLSFLHFNLVYTTL